MKTRQWIRMVVVVVVVLVLPAVLASALSAQTPKLEQIHVLTLVGRPLPVVVGEKRGTFAKFGIEVVTENCAGSDLMRAALAAGQGDLAYAAVDNAVAMMEIAGIDVVIVSGGEGSQNELIAQPGIKSIKELQGKTLLVDAVNTAYALQLKKIMLLSGMQSGRDYEMKAYGATPLRLQALLKHKEFAGSMLGPPASLTAKRAALVSLGSIPNLIGSYQAGGHFARRKWAVEHRETLVKYLAAYIESQRWMMDPPNKKQVMEIMAQEYKLSPEIVAGTYELSVTAPGGFEKDAELDQKGFENVLKLRVEVEGQWDGHVPPTNKYYDETYYQAALAKMMAAK
jgi:ABC-type nitrate/sulfonate/bicarbonate transport system substrate-binding protein